jgi:hypothetical protein
MEHHTEAVATIPPELHRFLLALMTAREFRDWLYAAPDRVEAWLTPDDYLGILELDYDDRFAVETLRSDLRRRFVPLPASRDAVGGDPDLMVKIRAAPDTIDHYLVLGDALQLAGDPRGEMIALQAGALRRESYLIQEAVTAIVDRHPDALLGRARDFVHGFLRLDWFLGFVARARIEDRAPISAETLREILTHSSFTLLRELDVEGPLATAAGTIPSTPALSVLRLLYFRSFPSAGLDLTELLRIHRYLHVLEVHMNVLELGEADGPNLRSLSIDCEVLWLRSHLFARGWPKLERLEVRLHGGDATFLDQAQLPGLRHLVVRGADEPVLDRLLEHPLLAQLSTLKMDLGERDVVALIDRATRFQHLADLELHATTTLSSGDASRIRSLLPRALIH